MKNANPESFLMARPRLDHASDPPKKPGVLKKLFRAVLAGALTVGTVKGVYEVTQTANDFHHSPEQTAHLTPLDLGMLEVHKDIAIGKPYRALDKIVNGFGAQALNTTDFWHSLSLITQANLIDSNHPYLVLSKIPRSLRPEWSVLEWTDANWSRTSPFNLALTLFTNPSLLHENEILNVAAGESKSRHDYLEFILLTEEQDEAITFTFADGKLTVAVAKKNSSNNQFVTSFSQQYDYQSMNPAELRNRIKKDLHAIDTKKFTDTLISVSRTTARSYSLDLAKDQSATLAHSGLFLPLNGIVHVSISENSNNSRATKVIIVQTSANSGKNKGGSGYRYIFEIDGESITFQGRKYDIDHADYGPLSELVDFFLSPGIDLLMARHDL